MLFHPHPEAHPCRTAQVSVTWQVDPLRANFQILQGERKSSSPVPCSCLSEVKEPVYVHGWGKGAVGEGAEHPCWEVSSGSWRAPVWGPGIG